MKSIVLSLNPAAAHYRINRRGARIGMVFQLKRSVGAFLAICGAL
jgi:hypothetical protein